MLKYYIKTVNEQHVVTKCELQNLWVKYKMVACFCNVCVIERKLPYMMTISKMATFLLQQIWHHKWRHMFLTLIKQSKTTHLTTLRRISWKAFLAERQKFLPCIAIWKDEQSYLSMVLSRHKMDLFWKIYHRLCLGCQHTRFWYLSLNMWFPTMWHFDNCRLRWACAASF